jgi:predicted DNA-binding WGR domain protein
MRRDLIFMDAKSSKFWSIQQAGSSHTVTYGRIGSKGQSATKSFSDEQSARKDAEKLIREKLSKGYVDAPSSGSDEAGGLDSVAFTGISHRDDIFRSAGTFVGQRVVDYDPAKPARSDLVYRFRSDWDGKRAEDDLTHFLASDAAPNATALVIGAWQGDDSSTPPDEVVKVLVTHRHRLPALVALYLGDIVSEENEMSWIHQTDLSPILEAFPRLQLLRARGGESLALSKPAHDSLRALILETGGMSGSVVRSLGTARLPRLEHLELWLGTDEYGRTTTVEDLRPILLGETFPNLRYLGLRNCDIADQLAQALCESPVVQRLEALDLSLGTLSDVGGQALLRLQSPCLKRLNLHHHYLSSEMAKSLKALPFLVDLSNPSGMDVEEDDRFVAVGE